MSKDTKTYYELGRIYSSYKEMYDYNKAIQYFERLLESGDEKVYYELARLYMSTDYFYPRDYVKDKKYLELAIKAGSKRAYSDLGIIEMKGLAGKKAENKARIYFEKANIQEYLVSIYGSLDSRLRDYNKAFDIALKNTTKDNEFLNTWLGYFYENGYRIPKNLKKSEEYYKKNGFFKFR